VRLNYVVTSNNILFLVRDQGSGEITQSMQLIAGRTAQQYNTRKPAGVPSGKTATMRPPSKPMNTLIAASYTSI
jgi:hypothetical protein